MKEDVRTVIIWMPYHNPARTVSHMRVRDGRRKRAWNWARLVQKRKKRWPVGGWWCTLVGKRYTIGKTKTKSREKKLHQEEADCGKRGQLILIKARGGGLGKLAVMQKYAGPNQSKG